jgi:hypothetical protein
LRSQSNAADATVYGRTSEKSAGMAFFAALHGASGKIESSFFV